MKLLGCHIENFGTFHNFDLTFNDGLNVVMQENGWGKTTLAAFVKAMLYGFDGKRVRNVAENERLRYRPWQGGKYGGWLDFESGGREYRVTRLFGATGSRDTVRVVYIATGKSALTETGESVGEWLFGLDANAFQKSVYVVQNGFGLSASTASLRNRLNALVNEADDVAGFDKAQAALEERRKYYKRTGNRGAIADASRDIAKLVAADAQAEEKISELRRTEGNLASYESSIKAMDEEIAKVRATAEQNQAAGQRARALRDVEKQLRSRQQEAQASYEKALREVGGELPDDEEIAKARQDVADLARLEQEASRTAETAAEAAERAKCIAAKYPDGLPQKEELQKIRDEVSSFRAQKAAFSVSDAERDEEFERLHATVTSEPGLLNRVDEVTTEAQDVLELIADGEAASRELQAARAGWDEKRKRLTVLVAEYEEKVSEVPEGAPGEAVELRQAARNLREASEEIARLDARRGVLESQLVEEQAKLDALPGGDAGPSATDDLEAAAKECDTAIDGLNKARAERDACSTRLKTAEKAARDAQTRLDEERAVAQQAKPGVPVPAIACFVAAVAAIAAGVVAGPVLFAVGAVLAVVGVVLLARSRSAGPSGPSDEAVRSADEAAGVLEKARAEYDAAELRLSDTEARSNEARDSLLGVVGELFPGEKFDDAAIVAQVPVLRERLEARPAQQKRVEEAAERVDSITSELDGAKEKANAIAEKFPGITGDSYAQLAAAMDERASELEAKENAARESKERLVAAVAEETGVKSDELDDGALKAFLATLEQEDPPGSAELLSWEQSAQKTSEEYVAQLNSLLTVFGAEGVGQSEIAVGAERLSKIVASYREELSRYEAAAEKTSNQAQQIDSLRKRIDAWALRVGANGIDDLTDERLESVAADVSAAEKAAWEERRARDEAQRAQNSLGTIRTRVNAFLSKHGAQGARDYNAAIDELSERKNVLASLEMASQRADSELKQWVSENGEELASVERLAAEESKDGSAVRLGILRQQRDALVTEKARLEEQQSSTLSSLEGRLAVRQELELLSKRKQQATANLFTIQKTSDYLRRAREGLDGRYLGDLAGRFGDYANTWLDSEEVEVAVGPDFDVALVEGTGSHDVAGYSTGYQDLLDMCFRMALIDTVFQAEPPFLIMDDPFASLDAEKIGNAFLLLQSLAEKYQIIYFTCHPSRTEAQAVVDGKSSFALPEQHARRELPRARAKKEAEERAKAQAELVASYVVAPVSHGRASIAPVGKRHSISSNLFAIQFEVDDSQGSADNSFEVHFIDGKGRVLCDRQTVEVIGGRTVPDKVRFSLVTRDDSGDTYDLVIHEDGREPTELAARIPFKADVSFATDDFGF